MQTQQQRQKGSNGGAQKVVKETDQFRVGLIGVYLIQKLGMPTLQEIVDTAQEKCSVDLDADTLARSLKGMSKKHIVAIERRKVAGGTSATVYSMRLVSSSAPPEFAHVSDLLPALLHTDAAQAVKDWFEGQDAAGKTKKIRGNVVDDYYAYQVVAKTLDPLLGSQPPSPYLDGLRDKFRGPMDLPKDVEVDGYFARDGLTGEYVITPDVLQGWFMTNAGRYAGMQDKRATYVAFAPVRIRPTQPVQQLVLPVNSQRGVSAPKPHEAIQPGEMIRIDFMAPTKGFLSPEQVEKVLVLASLRPRRGLSPARGRRLGRFLIVSFKVLGAVKKSSLDFLAGDISEDVLAGQDGQYLRDAMKRLRDVEISANFTGPAPDDDGEPFPGGDEE